MESITDMIKREILSWPDVTSGPHRFGGLELRVGKCEIGHLHRRRQADIPFSARLRKELIAAGRASPHHIYPNSGWSYYIRGTEDVPALLELLRLNYDRLATGRCASNSEDSEEANADAIALTSVSRQ